MTAEHEAPPGDIVVCITEDAVPGVLPDGSLVDDRGKDLADVLGGDAKLRPMFEESQARLRHEAADAGGERHGAGVPDLSRFYIVETSDDATRRSPGDLVQRLGASDLVVVAYFKHPPELPEVMEPIDEHAAERARADEPMLRTPDFTELQAYLGPASQGGIDARSAWTGPGGAGEGVQIIDIESAWRFSHEDLAENFGGVLNTAPDDPEARNHGTAVAGILSADANGFGITGICPGATIRGISVHGERGGSAAAVRRAADRLGPGDIILIEAHTPGPVSVERAREARAGGRRGYVPIDIWAEDFAAVRYATARGVIVVAAAGNGSRNLDDVDDLLTLGAREKFANPFDRKEADSGAIFVGAGVPPGEANPARSRLAFSNWGSCVDAQGWGRGVVTTGGVGDGAGDLQGGQYENRWYRKSFGGTSSAAPMIAGALACVQGVLMAEGFPPLTPRQARALLRMTGMPQVMVEPGAEPERIGPLPDLGELIPRALMMSGGPDFVGGGEPSPYGGMNMAIVFGGCGGGMQEGPYGGGSEWAGPHWRGPHWRGPHWRGPHWRGPHWRGPHWRGPHWRGPHWRGPEAFGSAAIPGPLDVSGSDGGGRQEIRRPGFSR